MKYIISSLSLFLLLFSSLCYSQKPGTGNNHYSPQGDPIRAYLNLNNISTVFKNDGISDIDVFQSNSGFVFPKGSGKTAVFTSGLLWGAFIPGDPQVRVGGSAYRTGLQGGKILSPGVPEDPDDPHVRIFRVRPDVYPGGPFVDLSVEAIDEGKSEAEIRAQYELDWIEWRAQDGAPYLDGNNNGQYDPDPFSNDVPGIEGANQTVWFVANDLNAALTTNLYGAQPIGIEYQATYWAYNNGSFIDNLFFRKYRLINKSTTTFNDMYVTMWSDPDIGDALEDYAGSDTTLNMVYAYNAFEFDAVYDPYPPPAVGFTLLKGPSVTGNPSLAMTASYYFLNFDPLVTDPMQGTIQGSDQFYNFMQGRVGLTGNPFIDPTTGLQTKFPLNGDPLTGEGWIDGILNDPGDRRIGLASGPFNMAIGDTQEIVIAEIAAIGLDNLNAFKILRFYNVLAKDAFDNGLDTSFISPPKPPIPVVTVNDADWVIELNWGTDTTSVNAIENFDQGGYAFQGYNVYQLANPLPIKENAVRVATYDIIDGITGIPGIVMDPETGLPINGILQYGSDSGIERMLSTHHDHIKNENMRVGKKYYFAVTAYTYNSDPQANPNNSESLIDIIEAVFYDSLPGANYGDSIFVTHSAGIGNGNVYVTIDDPTQLTGHDYEVSFHTQQQIRNKDGDWVPAGTTTIAGPDTLTGTTIVVAAVYGSQSGTTELRFHLDVVHHYYGWVDGVILTFPANVTIISSPPFEAGGGTVTPEIIGQEIHYGVTDNSGTGNGIFHEGGEDWIVIVAPIGDILPVTIEWTAFDDGYAGGGPPLDGTTTVTEIGFASRLAKLWNLLDVTTGELALEDISIVNGIDLFPRREGDPIIVPNPIVDGFQINVDISYDPPIEFTSLELYSPSGLSFLSTTIGATNQFIRITNYTVFGGTVSSKAIDNFGVGTNELSELQQDYELRFTGVLDTMILPDGRTFIFTESGGSIATIFRIQGGDFTIHPSNTMGTPGPFLLRIPFEVWNVEDPENEYQVNLTFRDRVQDFSAGGSDPLYSWNLVNRMYSIIVNSPYDPTRVIQVDNGPDPFNDPATWILVHWGTNFHLDDVVTIFYRGAVQFGIDEFTFTTPDPVVSVEDESIVTTYELFQNYPNPFNPTTKIRFNIPVEGIVKLEVYDILGQRVAQLLNTELTAGPYEVVFRGNNLASGVYFYMLNVKDKFFEVKKMLLLK